MGRGEALSTDTDSGDTDLGDTDLGDTDLGLAQSEFHRETRIMQYFEDIAVGDKASFGNYQVTREEVIAYAEKFDPQPFHLSDEAAAKTHFGRLSASGWHTCGMVMSMVVANLKANKQAGLGSPGIDELRWLKPVYPGDTLRCETEVIEKRPSKSRPEMGSFRLKMIVLNQHDVPVLTFTSIGLVQTRPRA